MQARRFPFKQGWFWVSEGIRLWRKNPAILIFASFSYLLVLILLGSIPMIGQLVAYLIMPILSLGVLNICRAVDEGRKATPDILLSGFRADVKTLITVGGVYFAASIGVLLLTVPFDDGTLLGILTGTSSFDPEADLPNIGTALTIAVVFSLPVLATYWFAPVLVGWWKVSATKALFFSFYACVRNWRPMAGFGLTLAVMLGILPNLIVGVAAMLSPLLATLVTLMLPLFLIPVTFASFYANARDVFGPEANVSVTA